MIGLDRTVFPGLGVDQPMAERDFVSIEEAAQRTGLTPRALKRRRDEGHLTFYQSPADRRRRLIDMRELDDVVRPFPMDGRTARREAVKA